MENPSAPIFLGKEQHLLVQANTNLQHKVILVFILFVRFEVDLYILPGLWS